MVGWRALALQFFLRISCLITNYPAQLPENAAAGWVAEFETMQPSDSGIWDPKERRLTTVMSLS